MRDNITSWLGAIFMVFIILLANKVCHAFDLTYQWTESTGPVSVYIVQMVRYPGQPIESIFVLGWTPENWWTLHDVERWQSFQIQVFPISADRQRGPTSLPSLIWTQLEPGCVPCCEE